MTAEQITAQGATHNGALAQPRRRIRVMVVDDHPAVRVGLVQLLDAQPDLSVERACIDADGAVAHAAAEPVQVAVLDYQLGGENGLWLCRRLKGLEQPPRVVIFSAFANDHLAACSVVAGADALLNKGVLGSELCDAVRAVARGRRLLPRVSRPLADMLRRRLQEREQMMFGMLLAGIPNSEIARILGISVPELRSRAGAMLRKLEALPGEAPACGARRLDAERPIPRRRRPGVYSG